MKNNDSQRLLEAIAADATVRNLFADIRQDGARMHCLAKASAAPAHYTLEVAESQWRMALATSDRWLSESIESQLVESRDSLEELFEEELKDLDCATAAPTIRHFRDESKQYVFECTLPSASATADDVRTHFIAFESMFRQLGDMSGAGSD